MKPLRKLISGLLIISSLLLAIYHLNHNQIRWTTLNSFVSVVYNRNSVSEKLLLNESAIRHQIYKSHPSKLPAISNMKKENGLFDNTKNGNILRKTYPIEKEVVNSYPLENYLDFKKTNSPIFPVTQENQTTTSNRIGNFRDRENIMKVFEYRKQLLQHMCQKFHIRENSTLLNLASTEKASNPLEQEEDRVEYVSMSNFHLVRSASTMTCLINKVASTSLAVSLLKADGRQIPKWNEELSPHNAVSVLRPKTETEFSFAKKHFFKFLLVRHPFERLLSAYRDKIERADHWSLKKLRQHIANTLKEIRNLRQQRDEDYTESGNHMKTDKRFESTKRTFLEEDHFFLNSLSNQGILSRPDNVPQDHKMKNTIINRFLKTDQKEKQEMLQTIKMRWKRDEESVDLSQRERMTKPNITENGTRTDNSTGDFAAWPVALKILSDREEKESPLPTFGDFLEYILVSDADGEFSSHWTPYWERCTPCSIQYDVIAKLETADRDLSVVYERLGIPQRNRQAWYNRSVGSKSPKRDILAHYSQLDPFLIGRVYRRFEMDFHLFEYDIFDVFRLAGYCNTSTCEEIAIYL